MEGETEAPKWPLAAPDEHLPSPPAIQKHEAPGGGADEPEEEEEMEEDTGSSSSDSGSDEEEAEEGAGRGRHGQGGARQAQLEWDDSTLPY